MGVVVVVSVSIHILTNPELVLSVVMKTGNCVRKFRSFVQANKSNTLKHIIAHSEAQCSWLGLVN